MDCPQLPKNDPFRKAAKLIRQERWTAAQRKTQSAGILTMNDLDWFFAGSVKSSFYKYMNGERGRPRKAIIDEVDRLLPDTGTLFTIGPNGIPLWAALGGKITGEDFWEPLVMSGQVSDVLELLSGGFDYLGEGVRARQPQWKTGGRATGNQKVISGRAYQDALRYEAKVILPTISWENFVLGLIEHYCPLNSHEPGEPWNVALMKFDHVTLGEATLAIGLAQLALKDANASQERKTDLSKILLGQVPFWERFDAASYAPKSEIAFTAIAMASRLQLCVAATSAVGK